MTELGNPTSFYEAVATVYDDFKRSDRYDTLAEVLLGEVLQRGRDPRRMSCLELGIGTGLLASQWAHRFATYSGVDCSRSMLALAAVGLPAIRLFHADLESPRSLSGSASPWNETRRPDLPNTRLGNSRPAQLSAHDLVVSVGELLNHIQESTALECAIANVAAVLRPAGLAILDLLTERGLAEMQEPFDVTASENPQLVYRWAAASPGRHSFKFGISDAVADAARPARSTAVLDYALHSLSDIEELVGAHLGQAPTWLVLDADRRVMRPLRSGTETPDRVFFVIDRRR